MKHFLLSFCAIGIFTISGYSQDLPQQTTDSDGKVFFKSFPQSSSILENEEPRINSIELDWSNEDDNVSENPTVDSWNQRMSVTSDGTVHIVYNDNHTNGLQKIMYRMKDPSGNWSTPIFVDKGGEIGARNNHFPSVLASENGDVHATYNVWAYENVRNYIGYSYYNAALDTWNDGVKVSDLGGTVNHTSGRHEVFTTTDDLPVIVWGWDNRENQTNEEIYLSYFDGTDWSTDIAVSDLGDNLNAGNPHVANIGDGKTMILFTQDTSGDRVLGYKIYDETTHDLTAFKTLPLTNVNGLNYSITASDNNDVYVITLHSETSPLRAAFSIYTYDSIADEFELSNTVNEIDAPSGNVKRVDFDCKDDGDCGIIYTDFSAEKNMFMSFNETEGYSTPLEINSEKLSFDAPSCEFDAAGNLHVVWNDKRFDDGVDFDENEVFYEMGVNTLLSVNTFDNSSLSIYPNPSKGAFNIQTQDNYTLTMFDLLGRTIATQKIIGPTTINAIHNPGTYILQFTGNEKVIVKKVIIQ